MVQGLSKSSDSRRRELRIDGANGVRLESLNAVKRHHALCARFVWKGDAS